MAGFTLPYAARGLTFLTHLSAGNQSLGVCQSHPTSGVHQSLLSAAATFTALPSPMRSSAVGFESLAPGAAGRGGSSLHIWCFLFDSPLSSLPWKPMSALGAPQLGIRAPGCSWPLWPAHSPSSWDVRGLGSKPSMATSCLCDVAPVKSQLLHLSSGPRKAPLMCRQRIYDKVCAARGTITHGDAQLLLLTELRPGRVVFTIPSKGLPLGYVPTWSHLDVQTPLPTAPDTAYGMA